MTVLVLSAECDPTADVLVEELQDRAVEVFRADLAWFPAELTLAADLDGAGWSGVLRTERRALDLTQLRSVLYRRPTAFAFPESLAGAELRHAQMEAKIGIGGCLGSIPGVLWVNHPARQADMYKPAQLATAKTLGFSVPRTLITNRPDAVRRFVRTVDGPVAVKPLGYASISQKGHRRALYTHVLSQADLTDLRGVDTTAHLFQQYIADKKYELRLTVVGHGDDNRMFPAAIYAGSSRSTVDFRADSATLTYRTAAVPDDLAARVRAFMRHFGITYGAFDFSVDSAGRHWFLECNPAGEYLFVERATGLPVTAALADLLEKGTP